MSTAIEMAEYKIPESSWGYLSDSYQRKLLTTKHGVYGNYQDLPKSAEVLGMKPVVRIPTKEAFWSVYEGMSLGIPNFPEGETKINQALALYEKWSKAARKWEPENVILRLSKEPFPLDEFEKDLETFTKHYIDRPKFWGFPSKVITRPESFPVAIFSGTIGGGLGGVLGACLTSPNLIPSDETSFAYGTLGALAGAIGSFTLSSGMHFFSEMRAKNKISHLDQYMSGKEAVRTIEEQYAHKIEVGIQRELYDALQQEGFNFTPEQFLEDVYPQIPTRSIGQYPDSLVKMVAIAHILYDPN